MPHAKLHVARRAVFLNWSRRSFKRFELRATSSRVTGFLVAHCADRCVYSFLFLFYAAHPTVSRHCDTRAKIAYDDPSRGCCLARLTIVMISRLLSADFFQLMASIFISAKDAVDLMEAARMQRKPLGVTSIQGRCRNGTVAYDIAETAFLTINTNTLFPVGLSRDFSILVVARPRASESRSRVTKLIDTLTERDETFILISM